MLYAYTDGSCIGNGKKDAKGGWGFFYGPTCDPKDRIAYGSGRKIPTTNNEMELMALLKLLEVLPMESAEIRVDSQYVMKSFVDPKTPATLGSGWIKGWIAKGRLNPGGDVKNRDLMLAVWELLQRRKNVPTLFVWVRGHSNDPGNEFVDALARFA